MPFLLGDLALDPERNIRDDAQFQAFRNRPEIEALGWPESPLRQWLWDFGDRDAFVDDYGAIDLSHVVWTPKASMPRNSTRCPPAVGTLAGSTKPRPTTATG